MAANTINKPNTDFLSNGIELSSPASSFTYRPVSIISDEYCHKTCRLMSVLYHKRIGASMIRKKYWNISICLSHRISWPGCSRVIRGTGSSCLPIDLNGWAAHGPCLRLIEKLYQDKAVSRQNSVPFPAPFVLIGHGPTRSGFPPAAYIFR